MPRVCLRVSLKWRVTKEQENFGGASAKRREAKNRCHQATNRGRISRHVVLPNSLHCLGTERHACFFSGAIFNAGDITEAPIKLVKQHTCLGALWRCGSGRCEVGPFRILHSGMVFAKDSVIIRPHQKALLPCHRSPPFLPLPPTT